MPHKDSSARPDHRRSISSKSYFLTRTADTHTSSHSNSELAQYPNFDVSSTTTTTKTSRIMTSVRKSIGSIPKRRNIDSSASTYGIISTPAEQSPLAYTRRRDHSSPRPTVEQIAMGLHTSRTPHLRPRNTSQAQFSSSSRSPSPLVLPPPPTRSSLKQPPIPRSPILREITPASASSSTVTSTHPPTHKSSASTSITSIKVRMARLLPRSRNASAPPSVFSVSSSATPSPRPSVDLHPPKKAVRFSTQEESDVEYRKP